MLGIKKMNKVIRATKEKEPRSCKKLTTHECFLRCLMIAIGWIPTSTAWTGKEDARWRTTYWALRTAVSNCCNNH